MASKHNNNKDDMTTSPTTCSSTPLLTIPSADVLRLILAHLTEAGLHQTGRCLIHESGVGLAGSPHSAGQWVVWATHGQWATVLESLAHLDRKRARVDARLVAQVHEMAILELADVGEWELAYAMYRLVQHSLEQQQQAVVVVDDAKDGKKRKYKNDGNMDHPMTLARLVEQKLAALASRRQKDPRAAVPDDYYGTATVTSSSSTSTSSPQAARQKLREDLGRRLQDAIPEQPKNRLNSLLQQAIKWQVHTGQLPRIRQWWEDEDDNDQKEESTLNTETTKKKRKRKKEFDLVLGQVQVDPTMVGQDDIMGSSNNNTRNEPIPVDPYSTVLFGKKATAEAAIFLPDGSGLVTGSSDGLIEIWDPAENFTKHRMDLPYQQQEELLGHDQAVTALAVSNDGTLLASGSMNGQVQIWRIDTGKSLRQWTAHADAAIAALSFSPDASHVLTGSSHPSHGTCREFGLRTARMLQEFRGHTSYLTSCCYHSWQQQHQRDDGTDVLLVITSSGDGTVRLWNAKSAETIRVLRPQSLGMALSHTGSSLVIDVAAATAEGGGSCPALHTVLPLHTPPNSMIVVPRGLRAFLVDYQQGLVLQSFSAADSAKGKIFVAATVSPSNRSLYAVQDDGVCCVFDVATGELLQTIPDFGAESTSRAKESKQVAEISAVIHHPNQHILGAFSNDKGQKRGKLVLWK